MKHRKYLLDTDMFSFVVDGRHQEVRRMVAKKTERGVDLRVDSRRSYVRGEEKAFAKA